MLFSLPKHILNHLKGIQKRFFKSRFILFSKGNIHQRKNIIINRKIFKNHETIEILENVSKNNHIT